MQHYQTIDFSTGLVTATILNVREGPSLSNRIITQVKNNEYIRVFAKIGNWYVVQTDSDFVGVASVDYIKPIYTDQENLETSNIKDKNNASTEQEDYIPIGVELTKDEKETFNLINKKRTEAGLLPLFIDAELQNIARLKALEMVDENYFSHISPTYGSPFDMIKSFKILYKTAGENIAGNSSNIEAVNAWMNSEGHKENVLNNSYNYTGIAVVNSHKYGKIYVQIFIGK